MATILLTIGWLLPFLPVVNSDSFKTHCTLPEHDVSYVSGPNVRSTLEIFWSSVFTIFLCTWTVLHLNVPQRHADPETQASDGIFRRYLRSTWRWLSRKPKWMVLAILIPEFLVGKSMADFIAAWRSTRCAVMQKRAREAGIEWTMTHAHYANMGGFILRDGSTWCRYCRNLIMTQSLDPLAPTALNYATCHHAPNHASAASTLEHVPEQYRRPFQSYSSQHKGWKSTQTHYENQETAHWNGQLPFAVRAIDLCALLSSGVIERLPAITKDHINGQNKEDVLIKGLTLLQVLWLFAQLIARKVQGLSSTQLEIATLSYAICTFVTYLFWLLKPKDVVLTTEVIAVRSLDQHDKETIIHISGNGFFKQIFQMEFYNEPSTCIPNDLYNQEATLGAMDAGVIGVFSFGSEDIGFVLGALVFGSAHLIAWNFQFPTTVEQVLWRVASLVTVGVIPLWYVIWVSLCFSGHLMTGSLLSRPVQRLQKAIQVCGVTVYLIYALCRVFILAEVLRSLFYLPPDAFRATWTGVVPYFS